jgi:hypothetical protein
MKDYMDHERPSALLTDNVPKIVSEQADKVT